MPTIIDLCDIPRSQLDEFLHLLSEMNLELYVDPSSEEPFIGIPDDPRRSYYPTPSKRVDRWIRGRWRERFGVPARQSEVKNVICRLDDIAYTRGAVLPAAVRQVRFGDDPVLAAINAWVPRRTGKSRIEPDAVAHQELWAIARHHPNKKAFPTTVESLQLHIKALDQNRMLAAVGIAFEETHLAAVTLLRFTRMPVGDAVAGDEPSSVADLGADDASRPGAMLQDGDASNE